MPSDLRLFLSSTFRDLGEVRTDILRHLEILRSEVLSMEFFGSDAARPLETALAAVARCNLFIGIYAHRYGTIDPDSGYSITELEYRQAQAMNDAGDLLGLLVYIISDTTPWPYELIELGPGAEALRCFKTLLQDRHTVTLWRRPDDLPLAVLGDTIRTIGLAPERLLRPRLRPLPGKVARLTQPLGMAHYTTELRALFAGRARATEECVAQVVVHDMSVLLGPSGIGKTSLIEAGVVPAVGELGWQTVVVRPLGAGASRVAAGVWEQLLEGPHPPSLDLTTAVRAALDAHPKAHLLVAIDQFEDVIADASQATRRELGDHLLRLHRLDEPRLHVLLAYRADSEGELGMMWQRVAGSSEGLPRTYLGPMSMDDSRSALTSSMQALGKSLVGTQSPTLETTVLNDVAAESRAAGFSGIYPPFLQMVISTLQSLSSESGVIADSAYAEAGRAEGIIGTFLASQLRYLGADLATGRAILLALTSSIGTKRQKTVTELAEESKLDLDTCRRVLVTLTDLRLIRGVDESYEIVHDYLARTVIETVATREEREAKRFQDVLTARAAAFDDVGALPTSLEHLYIYRNRRTIRCSEPEAKVLMLSHLAGNGPVQYWLRHFDQSQVVRWMREARLGSHLGQGFGTLEERRTIATTLRQLTDSRRLTLEEQLASLLDDLNDDEDPEYESTSERDYRWRGNLLSAALHEGLPLRARALDELCRRYPLSDAVVMQRLLGERSDIGQQLTATFIRARADELPVIEARSLACAKGTDEAIVGLHALGMLGSTADGDPDLLRRIIGRRSRPKLIRRAATGALVRILIREGRTREVVSLRDGADVDLIGLIDAVEDVDEGLTWEEVVDLHPAVAGGAFDETAPTLRGAGVGMQPKSPRLRKHAARAIEDAIARFVKLRGTEELRAVLAERQLAFGGDGLVAALCRGGGPDDFAFLLEYVRSATAPIELQKASSIVAMIGPLAHRSHLAPLSELIDEPWFWNPWVDGAASVRMQLDQTGSSGDDQFRDSLLEDPYAVSRFGRWMNDASRLTSASYRDFAAHPANAHLVRRIAGAGFCRIAGPEEVNALFTMLEHRYWTIWSGAATAIGRIGGPPELDRLVEMGLLGDASAKALTQALSELDEKLYGPSTIAAALRKVKYDF